MATLPVFSTDDLFLILPILLPSDWLTVSRFPADIACIHLHYIWKKKKVLREVSKCKWRM